MRRDSRGRPRARARLAWRARRSAPPCSSRRRVAPAPRRARRATPRSRPRLRDEGAALPLPTTRSPCSDTAGRRARRRAPGHAPRRDCRGSRLPPAGMSSCPSWSPSSRGLRAAPRCVRARPRGPEGLRLDQLDAPGGTKIASRATAADMGGVGMTASRAHVQRDGCTDVQSSKIKPTMGRNGGAIAGVDARPLAGATRGALERTSRPPSPSPSRATRSTRGLVKLVIRAELGLLQPRLAAHGPPAAARRRDVPPIVADCTSVHLLIRCVVHVYGCTLSSCQCS